MHLRYDNGNGTSKEWIITKTQIGLTIQYGKTGSRLRTTVIPPSACHNGVDAELQRRAQEKINKGYAPVMPNDPEALKLAEQAEKARKAKEKEEATERMSKLAIADSGKAAPPTWF